MLVAESKSYEEKMKILVELFKENQTAYSISKNTEISLSNVQLYLSQLETKGFLELEEKVEKGRNKKVYTLKEEWRLPLLEFVPELEIRKEEIKEVVKQIYEKAILYGSKILSTELSQEELHVLVEDALRFYKAIYPCISRNIPSSTFSFLSEPSYEDVEIMKDQYFNAFLFTPYEAMYDAIKLAYLYAGIPGLIEHYDYLICTEQIDIEEYPVKEFSMNPSNAVERRENGKKLFEYIKKIREEKKKETKMID